MPSLKIAVQLASLRQPFKQALLTAARLGATGVEIDARSEIRLSELTESGVRQIRKMLDDLNLRACALTFRTRRGYNTADELDRRVDATKEALRCAQALGAAVVVNHVGQIPEESTGPTWDMLLAALTDLGRYGDRVGATLAAETGSDNPADLARVLKALPDGALGVAFNPGELICQGFDPTAALDEVGKYILHVHAKDGVRERSQGRGSEVALGRGTADYPYLAAWLTQHRFPGWWTVVREHAAQPELEVGQAVQYLKTVIAGG